MLDIYGIKKYLIPITLTNALQDGRALDGYLYQGKFVMKGLGQMNERLFQMLAIDIDFSIMEVIDREVYDLKIHEIPNDEDSIGQWFYIKEE